MFTYNNAEYNKNTKAPYYTKDGKSIKKAEYEAALAEYELEQTLKKADEEAAAKMTAPTPVPAPAPATQPLIWTNEVDKKGRTIYKVNGKAVFLVERINKSRKASVYVHERLNSQLGEANGNKSSKYSRRIRDNIDIAFKAVKEEAEAWAKANLVKTEA